MLAAGDIDEKVLEEAGVGDLLDTMEEDGMRGMSLEEALESMLDEDDDEVTSDEAKTILRPLKSGPITRAELEKSAADFDLGCASGVDLVDGHAGIDYVSR